MPTPFYLLNGTWTPISEIWSQQNGTWKQVQQGYLNVNGAWELFYQFATIPSEVIFNGSNFSCVGGNCPDSKNINVTLSSTSGLASIFWFYTDYQGNQSPLQKVLSLTTVSIPLYKNETTIITAYVQTAAGKGPASNQGYTYNWSAVPTAPSISGGSNYSCVSACGNPIYQTYSFSSSGTPDPTIYYYYYLNGVKQINATALKNGGSISLPIYQNQTITVDAYASNSVGSSDTSSVQYTYTYTSGLPDTPTLTYSPSAVNETCVQTSTNTCSTTAGWSITLSSASANGGGNITIYYTTDGSDPRSSSTRGSVGNGGSFTLDLSTTVGGSVNKTVTAVAHTAYGYSPGSVSQGFTYTIINKS